MTGFQTKPAALAVGCGWRRNPVLEGHRIPLVVIPSTFRLELEEQRVDVLHALDAVQIAHIEVVVVALGKVLVKVGARAPFRAAGKPAGATRRHSREELVGYPLAGGVLGALLDEVVDATHFCSFMEKKKYRPCL